MSRVYDVDLYLHILGNRQAMLLDKRAEPRVGERVPYVVVCGTPGLPLFKLIRRYACTHTYMCTVCTYVHKCNVLLWPVLFSALIINCLCRPEDFLANPGFRLNATYYASKQILPALNRVFSLLGANVFNW